jgi:hypothetical protein
MLTSDKVTAGQGTLHLERLRLAPGLLCVNVV